jgi:hypothetical protein
MECAWPLLHVDAVYVPRDRVTPLIKNGRLAPTTGATVHHIATLESRLNATTYIGIFFKKKIPSSSFVALQMVKVYVLRLSRPN